MGEKVFNGVAFGVIPLVVGAAILLPTGGLVWHFLKPDLHIFTVVSIMSIVAYMLMAIAIVSTINLAVENFKLGAGNGNGKKLILWNVLASILLPISCVIFAVLPSVLLHLNKGLSAFNFSALWNSGIWFKLSFVGGIVMISSAFLCMLCVGVACFAKKKENDMLFAVFLGFAILAGLPLIAGIVPAVGSIGFNIQQMLSFLGGHVGPSIWVGFFMIPVAIVVVLIASIVCLFVFKGSRFNELAVSAVPGNTEDGCSHHKYAQVRMTESTPVSGIPLPVAEATPVNSSKFSVTSDSAWTKSLPGMAAMQRMLEQPTSWDTPVDENLGLAALEAVLDAF